MARKNERFSPIEMKYLGKLQPNGDEVSIIIKRVLTRHTLKDISSYNLVTKTLKLASQPE